MKKSTNEPEYIIVIDNTILRKYDAFYFERHPRARKSPIAHPYHESINAWMIMKRPMMNALKQRWKDFVVWLIGDLGYSNIGISKCTITQRIYYPTKRRHDIDNSVPKFILDGLVESGMIVDDDCAHITRLTLECITDSDYPHTEIYISLPEEGRDSGN